MSDIRLYPLNKLTALSEDSDKAMLVVTDGSGSESDAAEVAESIVTPAAIVTAAGTMTGTEARDFRESIGIGKTFAPEDFGAVGDCVALVDYITTITSGSPTLTVTGANFTAADVGKRIQVPGAGTAGGVLSTTISARISATQLTLAANASSTVSGLAEDIIYGTNDDAALQAAVDAAAAEGTGGTVILSRRYGLVSGIVLDKGWVTILGFSGGSWYDDGLTRCGLVLLANDTKGIRVRGPAAKSARGVILQDFTITGNRQGYRTATTKGIEFYPADTGALYPDGLLLRNVNCQWLNHAVDLTACDSPRIQGSRICDNYKALTVSGCIGANIVGNFIWDNDDYGVKLTSTNSYDAVVSANNFGRNGWDLWLNGCDSSSVTGNSFFGGPPSPVATQYGSLKVTSNVSTHAITISGNTFQGTGFPVSSQGLQTAALLLDTASNVAVTGNSFNFDSTTVPAVKITGGSGNAVVGNNFSPVTQIAISANSTALDTRIQGNTGPGAVINLGGNLPTKQTSAQVFASASINFSALPVAADNAAAITAELISGTQYRTATGELRIVVDNPNDEALRYIATLTGSYGVTVSAPQKAAIIAFIAAEKAASRWTGLKALYLTGWANARANALDLKTGKSGNFYGTMTHATGYAEGNGSTGYFDLGSNYYDLGLSATDGGIGALVYRKHQSAAYAAIIAADGNAPTGFQLLDNNGSLNEFYGASNTVATRTDAGGIYYGTRTGTTSKLHLMTNGGVFSSSSAATTTGGTIGAANINAWRRTVPDLYSNARIGALWISSYVSDAGAQSFAGNMETLWETLHGLTLP